MFVETTTAPDIATTTAAIWAQASGYTQQKKPDGQTCNRQGLTSSLQSALDRLQELQRRIWAMPGPAPASGNSWLVYSEERRKYGTAITVTQRWYADGAERGKYLGVESKESVQTAIVADRKKNWLKAIDLRRAHIQKMLDQLLVEECQAIDAIVEAIERNEDLNTKSSESRHRRAA